MERQRKPIKRNHVLHPIEKLVLQNLLENDPQTINQTATAIGKQYKSTFRAFTTLKKRNLIKKTKLQKEHKGRKYPCYWLTDVGIFKALIEGNDLTILAEKARKYYPENKDLLCIIKTAEIIGIETYEIVYSALLNKGRLEPSDWALILAIPMQKETDLDNVNQLLSMLEKEFPEIYRQVKENLQQFGIVLRQLFETNRRENKP